MFDSQQKSTGTSYTATAALLALAFVFSPAMLVISNSFGYIAISLAAGSSAICIALAWFNWKRYSKLTIPSMSPPWKSGAR